MKKNLLKIACLSLALCFKSAFAVVLLEVTPEHPNKNDNINLTFTYIGQNAAQPNFSVLTKDFTIENTAQSNQISIYNGVVERQAKWHLVLTPKHIGESIIPEISFADEKSPAKVINVSKASQNTGISNNSPFFMTASTSSKTPYVQQQFIYTIKFFYQVPPLSNETFPAKVDNAVLIPIGEGENYTTEINHVPYHVLEQHYAVFAEKPGQVTISSPTINVSVRRNNVRDISQLMNGFQDIVKISAPDTTITIQAIPKEFTGKTWLPSESITLDQTWLDSKETYKAGDPITREITLQATGLMASQLPDLQFDNVTGANVYPEPGKTKDNFIKGTTVGIKKFKVTYIPTGEGNIEIPAITIPWWNLKTKSIETAKIDGQHFTIIQNSSFANSLPTQKQPSPIVNNQAEKSPTLKTIKSKKVKSTDIQVNVILPWLLVAILLIGIGVSMWRKSKPTKKQTMRSSNSASANQIQKQFKKACMGAQPNEACQALIELMKLTYPDKTIRSLFDIQKLANQPLNAELKILEAALYGNLSKWQGQELWHAFLEFKQIKVDKKKSMDNILPQFN